jgi:hypothetical protein
MTAVLSPVASLIDLNISFHRALGKFKNRTGATHPRVAGFNRAQLRAVLPHRSSLGGPR